MLSQEVIMHPKRHQFWRIAVAVIFTPEMFINLLWKKKLISKQVVMITICVKCVHLGPHQVSNLNFSVKSVRIDVDWGMMIVNWTVNTMAAVGRLTNR